MGGWIEMGYCPPDMSDWTGDEMFEFAKAVGKIRRLNPFPFDDFCKMPVRPQEAIYNILVYIAQTNVEQNRGEDD